MKEKKLETYIRVRMYKSQKDKWVNWAKEKNVTITDLVICSVENKLLNSDRREVMSFIEKQGNIFAKIENNINQIAKIVNTEKGMSKSLMEHYNTKLIELNNLKIQQNDLLRKIYKLLAR